MQGFHVLEQFVVAAAHPACIIQELASLARKDERRSASMEELQAPVGFQARNHAAYR